MFDSAAHHAADVGLQIISYAIQCLIERRADVRHEALLHHVGDALVHALAHADPHGLLKLLFHPQSRRLLGVHAIGTGATELIHIGQAVLNLGGTVDYFVENAFNYPTLAEAYKIAALDAFNRMR
mgnify:CR=1 FL=1